ncbi:MAG: TIGR02281 family clan AA aspartic protease, partial [Actinomycetota bacterium]
MRLRATRELLVAIAMGLASVTGSFDRSAAADTAGTLTGEVTSSNDVSIDGAMVTLEGIGGVRTDAAGRFVFREVPRGHYRLTVTKDGFPNESRLVLVQTGRLNTVRIVLAAPAPLPPAPAAVAVPIVQHSSAILVRGVVNGQAETFFLVDTGATMCVLSTALADRAGLRSGRAAETITVHTGSGQIQAPLVLVDTLQVGGVEASTVQAIVHDVPGLSSDVGGLLGLSFLGRFRVEIDRVRGVMVLSH